MVKDKVIKKITFLKGILGSLPVFFMDRTKVELLQKQHSIQNPNEIQEDFEEDDNSLREISQSHSSDYLSS